MNADVVMPVPTLADAFALDLQPTPPADLGPLATGGSRSVVTFTAGRLTGRDLDLAVTTGSETRLARADGVTTLELVVVFAQHGAMLRLTGTGFETADHARLSIAFEAAASGPLAWLAERVFIAERTPGTTMLHLVEVC